MQIVEGRLGHKIAQALEIFLFLPGKPDDDVCAQPRLRRSLPQPPQDPLIAGDIRSPAHELKDAVRGVLE